jgi:PTS system N-acetylgalactosamine-specific IIA component
LLLDFAMQDDVDPVQAVQTALDRGRASMVVHGVVTAGA